MKGCNGVPGFQAERCCCCLRKLLSFLGCRSTVVSGEQVCGNDVFKISLERTECCSNLCLLDLLEQLSFCSFGFLSLITQTAAKFEKTHGINYRWTFGLYSPLNFSSTREL